MKQLSRSVKTLRLRPDGSGFTVAAGATAVNSDIVDTAGADGVRFITGWGAIVSGAVTSQKVQQNDVNSGTGMADLAGTNIAVADTDDNKVAVTDIIRPLERFLRVAYSRATQNATIDFLLVELYYNRSEPVTQDSSVATLETFQSPAEGTA